MNNFSEHPYNRGMENKNQQYAKDIIIMKKENETVIGDFSFATEFAVWMEETMVYEVLSEFWHWYNAEIEKIEAMENEDEQEELMEKIHELVFDELPLKTLHVKFSIHGEEFEVKDALSIASYPVSFTADEIPESPKEWSYRGIHCTDGVKEFAYGFFIGVVTLQNKQNNSGLSK